MTPKTEEATLRIRDVVRETGVPRKTIHFWIAEGLVPRPVKTGRNAALYGPEHVERIRQIRELQRRHFLPLKAIGAIVGGRGAPKDLTAEFTPEQCAVIEEVREHFERTRDDAGRRRLLDILAEHDLDPHDAEAIVDLGILDLRERDGELEVSAEDARLAAAWARLRSIGLTPERGFTVYDAKNIQRAVEVLFQEEARIALERLGDVGPETFVRIVDEAMPVANEIFAILHEKRIRQFFREFRGARKPNEEEES